MVARPHPVPCWCRRCVGFACAESITSPGGCCGDCDAAWRPLLRRACEHASRLKHAAMSRLFIHHRLKAAGTIEGCAAGGIGGQAHLAEVSSGMGNQLLDQAPAQVPAPERPGNEPPAQPADARRCEWVLGKTANRYQLALHKSCHEAFAGVVEAIGAGLPFGNQAREKPEALGDGLFFQNRDVLGQCCYGMYCWLAHYRHPPISSMKSARNDSSRPWRTAARRAPSVVWKPTASVSSLVWKCSMANCLSW